MNLCKSSSRFNCSALLISTHYIELKLLVSVDVNIKDDVFVFVDHK